MVPTGRRVVGHERRLNILYIHQYFSTPTRGGGTRSYEFSKRLVSAGHKVWVITGTPVHELAGDLPEGIEVFSTNTSYDNRMLAKERVRAFLHFAARATRIGMHLRPDVIYATSTPLTVGVPALFLSRFHRVPYVFEVRDLWPEAPIAMGVIRNPLVIRALRQFERTIYSHAAHIVALSPGMVEGVRTAGVEEERVSMIPNACDLDTFSAGPIDMSFLQERGLPIRPTVAYAGALGEANAVDVLGQAAAILRASRVDVQIVVAGDGKMRPVLEKMRDHETLTNLWLIGKLPKYEVARLYRASVAGLVLFSDVPVLQTNSPNKFFDILAAGRPVITNMRGWIAEMVKQHGIGYVVPSADGAALAEAIALAVASENIEGMGRAARRLGEEAFSRDRLASQVEGLLETVVLGRTHDVR